MGAATCETPWILVSARLFFVGFNIVLIGGQYILMKKIGQDKRDDAVMDYKRVKSMQFKAIIKVVILAALHAKTGMTVPLVAGFIMAGLSLPIVSNPPKALWYKYSAGSEEDPKKL